MNQSIVQRTLQQNRSIDYLLLQHRTQTQWLRLNFTQVRFSVNFAVNLMREVQNVHSCHQAQIVASILARQCLDETSRQDDGISVAQKSLPPTLR